MDRSEIRSRIFGHANISRICINCVKSDRFRSAAEQLISGGSRLFANANQLVSGTKQLVSGTNHLVSGTNQLVSGTNQLITGTNQLISGTNQLIRRFDQLWHGIVGWLGSVTVLLPVVVGGLGSRGAGVPDPRGGAHGAGPTTSGWTSSGYTRPKINVSNKSSISVRLCLSRQNPCSMNRTFQLWCLMHNLSKKS